MRADLMEDIRAASREAWMDRMPGGIWLNHSVGADGLIRTSFWHASEPMYTPAEWGRDHEQWFRDLMAVAGRGILWTRADLQSFLLPPRAIRRRWLALWLRAKAADKRHGRSNQSFISRMTEGSCYFDHYPARKWRGFTAKSRACRRAWDKVEAFEARHGLNICYVPAGKEADEMECDDEGFARAIGYVAGTHTRGLHRPATRRRQS